MAVEVVRDAEGTIDAPALRQRRVLALVLLLNVLLSVALTIAGVYADSNGLIANALDNASDSAVYVISYFAVGRSPRRKRVAATVSGVMLLVLALAVTGDALRRLVVGAEPVSGVMVVMGLVAAGVNLYCLRLLGRLPTTDVNLRAARTFSVNDFVSNLGLLVAAGLVAWSGTFWPDVLVGLAIAAVAAKGGVEILRDAQHPARTAGETSA